MIVIKDKAKASQFRRELAAELSKPKNQINVAEVKRIRAEIAKAGYRCGANPRDGFNFRVQEWSKDAADRAV